jgi:hypothetical protein
MTDGMKKGIFDFLLKEVGVEFRMGIRNFAAGFDSPDKLSYCESRRRQQAELSLAVSRFQLWK